MTTTVGRLSAALVVAAGLTGAGCQLPEPPKAVAARPPGVATVASMERAVVDRINEIRAERGLPPLQPAADLGRIAREHSCRMAEHGSLSHIAPGGGTLRERIGQAGYEIVAGGENLAHSVNQADPVASAVQGWMKSAGHRDNILRREFSLTGVGVCRRDGSGHYFTQIFVRPR